MHRVYRRSWRMAGGHTCSRGRPRAAGSRGAARNLQDRELWPFPSPHPSRGSAHLRGMEMKYWAVYVGWKFLRLRTTQVGPAWRRGLTDQYALACKARVLCRPDAKAGRALASSWFPCHPNLLARWGTARVTTPRIRGRADKYTPLPCFATSIPALFAGLSLSIYFTVPSPRSLKDVSRQPNLTETSVRPGRHDLALQRSRPHARLLVGG